MSVLLERFDLDWLLVVSHFLDLALAYILSLPIAWDREQRTRSAGLRTFPLVAISSCGFTLIAFNLFSSDEAYARVIEGVITGIGFIGGGAILKSERRVSGTATAASLWATGAMGIAVAGGRLEIAFIISIVTFLTLSFIRRYKKRQSSGDEF